MSAESLIGHLSTITQLTPGFAIQLNQAIETEHYKPHQIIHAAGQIENRLWYVSKGFVRTYYFDQAGKEHTLSFFSEKDIIFSHQGHWKESTDYYIEVLEESELLAIHYDIITKLLEQFAEMKTLVKTFTRHRHYQEIFKSRLMSATAEERYQQFRRAHPHIFKKASIRLIASYLNMTRENLSRLMSREA